MTAFDPIREVRFGVVMYGGVSLAVYINGVAQELYHLVRATAPSLADDSKTHIDDDDLGSTERVYRDLGRLYGEPTDTTLKAARATPVRTRFVVDIMSGSSAGGINAIYLGKALANSQGFTSLKQLWIEKGDVGTLLNDRKTRKERKDRLPEKEPAEALFSGDVMYLELLDALDAMDADHPGSGPDNASRSPYVDDLDVWITATDLEGIALPLRLADVSVYEKKHRHTFHFVFGEEQAVGGIRNDFAAARNPMLAFAARATSAFPFAFVPARLADIARVRRAKPHAQANPLDESWRPWFANHRQIENFDYQNVSFGDGGDMDNKPFGWVIDTLPARTSSTPVDRRLLYVEPDPGDPTEPAAKAAARPDVVGSTAAAVMLGRVEATRDEIERLAKVSDVRARIGAVTRAVDRRYKDDKVSEALRSTTMEWLTEGPDVMKARGLPYAAYYSLRIETLTTEYARSLVGLSWHAPETPESAAMRALTAHWVAVAYSDPYRRARRKQATTKAWLRDFDIAYRIRRLTFVAGQADRLYREQDSSPAFRAEARRIKAALAGAEKRLRLWVPSIRSSPTSTPRVIVLEPNEVDAFGTADDPAAWAAAAWHSKGPAFLGAADAIAVHLRFEVFAAASKAVKHALDLTEHASADPRHVARRSVLDYFERFDDFDQVTFPLFAAAGSAGELDDVQVHRISPRDTTRLVEPKEPKLAGSRLGHFGGFLAAGWRENDIMWGRLDTAERLIRCLLPGNEAAQEELLASAHDVILCEEWYVHGRGGAPHLQHPRVADPSVAGRVWRFDQFRKDYAAPPWPETSELLALASRATRVVGAMLEDVAARPGVKASRRIVAAVGWLLTALSTVAFPREAWRAPVRLVASVAFVLGATLAVLGTVLNWDAAAATGWPLAGAAAASLLSAFAVRVVRRRVVLLAWLVVALAVVGLAGYGGWALWDEYVR